MQQRANEMTDPVTRLREFVRDGGYFEGAKLPPERHLTDRLGMTRSTLRKALDALEREGTIWRHVGKGTFVADNSPNRPKGAIVELGRQLTPYRMMRARMAIEPGIAREAAINASAESRMRMRRAMDRARGATSWDDYETQDDLFHRTIAEASDNLLLLSLFDQLNQVRRAVAWENVTRLTARPLPDHPSFQEHEAIAAAINGCDPKTAHDAMRNHLRSVSARLFGET